MGQENNAGNMLLNQIASKIVSGSVNWTPEELQYQKNHPEEVEKALHEYRKKAQILDRVVVTHCDYSFLKIKKAAVGLGAKPKIITYPEAIALATMVPSPVSKDTKIAILTIAQDVLDIGLIDIEDGVYEVCYMNCISPISADSIYRLWKETRWCDNKIDHLMVVTNDNKGFHYLPLVEKLFDMKAECKGNLQQLVQRGREVQAGVMTGEVKDVLLLSVTPQTIGIEMEEGLMLPLIEANTTIPTRVNETLFLDADVSGFRIDIWQGNECYAWKNDLIGVLYLKNQNCQQGEQREMELMVDIDACGCCVCRLTDKKYNVTTEIKLL